MKKEMMKEIKDFYDRNEIELLKTCVVKSATAMVSSEVLVGAAEHLVKRAGTDASFIKDPKLQMFLGGSSIAIGGLLTYIDAVREVMHHQDVSAAYNAGYHAGVQSVPVGEMEKPDFIVKEDDED